MIENLTASLPGSSRQDNPNPAGWRSEASSGRLENVMPTYRELLLDPRWQKKRLKKLEAAGWICEACYDDSKTLAVHHKQYRKGHMPWEYDDAELVVLCQPCHEQEHELQDALRNVVARLDPDGPASARELYAFGAGAMDNMVSDSVARAALGQIQEDAPHQYAAGRVARNLSMYIATSALVALADRLEPRDGSIEVIQDIRDLLDRRGINWRYPMDLAAEADEI